MSIEQEIQDLTQSTTDLLNAVNTKKVTLDNSVSQALTAVTDATSQVSLAAAEKVGAQTARDTAESFKDQAYTYSQSAASAVAYQDLTAIAQTKAETAVDVFVYDTSKDSDGGAWRKRTQGTSWYNETLNTATRGSRKEFPAVAVIVAESNKVTIYDGDDPSLPMWMVFERDANDILDFNQTGGGGGSPVTAVTALNGILTAGQGVTGNGSSVRFIEFISDTAYRISDSARGGKMGYSGVIEQRNDGRGGYTLDSSITLVNLYVNDVAMTVLPDAPIDPATGLPIPTIAVATDGGVSVIKDDGTVVDITGFASGDGVRDIAITPDGGIWTQGDYHCWLYPTEIPEEDFSNAGNFQDCLTGGPSLNSNPEILGGGGHVSDAIIDIVSLDKNNATVATSSGVTKFSSSTSISEGSVAYITSTYNTGWMNGDIKLATLSDTDDTDLVGSELVTNGTFDTDTSGWTTVSGSSVITFDNGRLKATKTASGSSSWMARGVSVLTTEVGKQYLFKADISRDPSNTSIQEPKLTLWDTTISTTIANFNNNRVAQGITFTALSNGRIDPILVQGGDAVDGDVFYIDNVSCVELEPDRSVNNNGLQVFGTVQKNPVATGADLVAYSGFSASNYLEQPYNSDLDFGTGDFCVMGWMKAVDTGATYQYFCGRGTSTEKQWLRINTDDTLSVLCGSTQHTSSAVVPYGTWAFLVLVRSGGTLKAYVNNVEFISASNSADLTLADATLRIAHRHLQLVNNFQGSLALWRVSATAPTAEQIKKIYEDEKVLFQENAKATLHGTSDAVTALAYDDTTELLHVGTSGGRSVFQGLKRVDNTTDAVGTAISASNNLVVEE